jgi:glycosyltransferase involved in cell wall biosynthesis
MRIAFVTPYDARDVKRWSGLGYFIWQALVARGLEVELIGPLPLSFRVRKLMALKARYHRRVSGKFYWPDGDLLSVRGFSAAAGRKLKTLPPVDAVVSPTILSTAFLPGRVPLVIYSDTTLRKLFATYPAHANMARGNYRQADKIEFSAHRRASALVYASEWAAKSAHQDYSADPAKIHVVPFGANLETAPARAIVEQAIEARDRRPVNLLFIGVEWERKGGPTALAVTRHLNRLGIPAQLTVIGCPAKLAAGDEKIVNQLGFLKKDIAGQARIQAELAQSHFLIVPSIAECFGLVYCEASSFGVPSIARDVGGVPSAVRNGRNGQRFSMETSPEQIAEWIAAQFKDFATYRQLALTSLAEFDAHLNWKVAGEKLENIIRSVVKSH